MLLEAVLELQLVALVQSSNWFGRKDTVAWVREESIAGVKQSDL